MMKKTFIRVDNSCSTRDKITLSVKEYRKKIWLYLKDVINGLTKSYASKIRLTIAINLMFSKNDNDEERVMDSESDNMEIEINLDADEVIEERKIDGR